MGDVYSLFQSGQTPAITPTSQRNTLPGGITMADIMGSLKPGQQPSDIYSIWDTLSGRQTSWDDPNWSSAFSNGASIGALQQQQANSNAPAALYDLMQRIAQAKNPQPQQQEQTRAPVASGQSLFAADQAKGHDVYKPLVQPQAGDYRQQFGLLR